MTVLDKYWPLIQQIDECIRTEAEVVDDAVLLAVHEPGPLRTRSANGVSEAIVTEKDLLDELLRPANDGSAVLVAITGDSGVGKSHMVRWLHAQLKRHPKRDQLVVVLVPKTASLRQVVELILEPLKGDTYRNLQHELSKAVEHLNTRDAALMLATSLAIELDHKYEDGIRLLRESGENDRGVRDRLGLTKHLRELLRDADVLDSWFGNVLERIVHQTLEGGSESQTGELRRFVPDDLVLPETWMSQDIKRSTQAALQQLIKDDGARRPLAADILQEALDPALRAVFRFSEALGQRTIEEIVGEIRERLLVDGKELVLLIEDFAALAGIQQPLLNLMIAESDHGGKRVRAPLRTALAVTDGFLPSRQTILTRAQKEWIIPNHAHSDDELVKRFIDLAGRYLNAARWGVAALREQFQTNGSDDLHDWVRIYEPPVSAEEADMLSAFGRSQHGHPLFPLSPEFIESMCRRELKSGQVFRFNPRAFINAVLRDTLLLRSLHESQSFPPPNFKGATPSAAVEMALKIRSMPDEQRERLGSTIVHWGNNPSDLSISPTVSKGVFSAFSLPWPFASEFVDRPREVKLVPRQEKSPTSQEHTSKPTPQLPLDYIEEWATGDISQAKALEVRKLLQTALNDRIDWSAYRMRGRRIEFGQIWLPFARVGNPTTDPKIIVAEATRPLCSILRAGLKGLERWIANGKSWDYANSEDDYSISQQLLDRLESQIVAWQTSQVESKASAALHILHRQALLLGMSNSADPRNPQLADYYLPLSKSLRDPDPSDRTPAGMIAAALLRAEQARVGLQQILSDATGCFQGSTGTNLYALDPRRISAAWRRDIPDIAVLQLKAEQENIRLAADEMLARVNSLFTRYRNVVEPIAPEIKVLIGDDVYSNLSTELEAQIEQSRVMGSFPQAYKYADAKVALECLNTKEAKGLIRRVLSFNLPDDKASVNAKLACWASLDVDLLVKVHAALVLINEILRKIEQDIDTKLLAIGGGDVGAMVVSLKADLSEVAQREAL